MPKQQPEQQPASEQAPQEPPIPEQQTTPAPDGAQEPAAQPLGSARKGASAPTHYSIVHSGVGTWRQGERVSVEQLGEGNLARLLELGAIAPAEEREG